MVLRNGGKRCGIKCMQEGGKASRKISLLNIGRQLVMQPHVPPTLLRAAARRGGGTHGETLSVPPSRCRGLWGLPPVAAGPSGVSLAVSRAAVRTSSHRPAMAASWLAGLWKSLWAPAPGTPEARLEEKRVGALLDKELAQPPGQRDEERVRQLRMEHTKLLLGNYQVRRWRRRWPRLGAAAVGLSGRSQSCAPIAELLPSCRIGA